MSFGGTNPFPDSPDYIQLPPLYLPDTKGSRKQDSRGNILIPAHTPITLFPLFTHILVNRVSHIQQPAERSVSKKVPILIFNSKRGCSLPLTSAVYGC